MGLSCSSKPRLQATSSFSRRDLLGSLRSGGRGRRRRRRRIKVGIVEEQGVRCRGHYGCRGREEGVEVVGVEEEKEGGEEVGDIVSVERVVGLSRWLWP